GVVVPTDPLAVTELCDLLKTQQEHRRNRNEREHDVQTHARSDEQPRRQTRPHTPALTRATPRRRTRPHPRITSRDHHEQPSPLVTPRPPAPLVQHFRCRKSSLLWLS